MPRHQAIKHRPLQTLAATGSAFCVLALAAAGCTTEPLDGQVRANGPRPSVLLVTIDTLRADHVHAYGYARATSPHIDALAADGVLFETAYAPSSATGPSHATLFTARQPLGHGVVRNGIALDPTMPTIASLLSDAGYQSAGFVSSYPVSRKFGFAHGFAHYDEDFGAAGGTMTSKRWQRARGDERTLDRRGAATVDAAAAWLAQQPDGKPLFVWVHLFDPHAPYAPPAPYDATFTGADAPARQHEIDLYDGEIRYADAQLGRLLEAFERAAGEAGSLVVVTSDHGEGLWDHGYAGHNRDVFEEEVRVPLVVRWRGQVAPGRRVAEPVHLVDVLPTILAACGVAAPPSGVAGLDLLAALSAAPTLSADRLIYLTRPYFSEGGRRRRLSQVGWGFGIRRGSWKLIEAAEEGRLDLYDLTRDPGEKNDLVADDTARAAELAGLIETWRDTETAQVGERPLEVPRDVRRQLRALGYVQ